MPKDFQPGTRVQIQHMVTPEVYAIPKGLKAGDIVTIVSFDAGYFTVRRADGVVIDKVFCLLVK